MADLSGLPVEVTRAGESTREPTTAELRLTARLMMALVDSGRSWGESGHEGVNGEKQVIGVMDAAAVIAAAVAEPSFLPWLMKHHGYEKHDETAVMVGGRLHGVTHASEHEIGIGAARHRDAWTSPWSPVTDKETSE